MNEKRFKIFDQLCFNRALETFPEEPGTCPEYTSQFILSILEVSENSDKSTLQNAINFARSWAELGFILPQKVMNRVLRAAFEFPIFIPQLSLLSPFFSNKGWLFNALLKLIREQPDLFFRSIEKNNSVWNFIFKQFDQDFFDKSEILDIEYSERPFSFLSEVLIFEWPSKNSPSSSEISIANNVRLIAEYCLAHPGEVADSILNCIAPLFPNEILPILAGKAEVLNGNNLAYFFSLYSNDNDESDHKKEASDMKNCLTGDSLTMALKLLPKNLKLAQSLVEGLGESEKRIFDEMLSHYNEKTKHFTVT
ncbi:hypothetical protein TRFO_19660 [Tritrichomonas foetus]|uniref:Uncharacterized protein n=1 Tax=Tritrichomonas foetus TaxID=1144522 RepID=A0A1J4KIV8_9EUKA|nr:hypothetical protein TRFO_19660 [Tritrichomonas foetus]|eukprot:OHT10872.1 hypothetical protein TRFO_19660 [Tritrichomonas foetus]